MKNTLRELALRAGVDFIRIRGNKALVRIDAYTTKLVDRSWLEEAIDELDFFQKT